MTDETPSALIDTKIASLTDWRGKALARLRALTLAADPDVVEEVKWRKPANPAGVPVWSNAGILCTGETYKDKVKLTFAKGASLPDPAHLFNASLETAARGGRLICSRGRKWRRGRLWGWCGVRWG